MTAPVVTTSPGANLHEVGRLMLEKGLKRIPGVDQGILVGLISRVNLLKLSPTRIRQRTARHRPGAA
ncbi:MAG: CBS domain-containing protein [Candidatus Dormibacteria bacterium]